jgi:hypothetical protein
MPGSITALFLPFRINGVLFGVYDYLLPIMLYAAWSTLVFLDLARAPDGDRSRVVRWSAIVLLLPLVGAAAYLLFGGSAIRRPVRIGAVAGGIAVVAAAFALTMARTSY